MQKDWSFIGVWNETLLDHKEREVVPRDHLWASELGKAPVDLYLRLKGTKPTNPPNARSLRKFEAGNIWEWIIKLILLRTGILISTQDHLSYQYDGLLEVTGCLDFIAGGKPDYKKARKELENLMLPEMFLKVSNNIVDYFEKNYPEGLDEKILEIKSTSAFMFEVYLRQNKSSLNHRMQNFHYLKAKKKERGSVIYICRDDCRMLDFPVLNPSTVEDEYKSHIKIISQYYERDEQPPLEKPIEFEGGRFTKNWKVAYSTYLTMLYKFKDQAEFDDAQKPITGRWNRVIGRAVKDEKMTDNNLEAIEEMKEAGFNPDICIAEAKKLTKK